VCLARFDAVAWPRSVLVSLAGRGRKAARDDAVQIPGVRSVRDLKRLERSIVNNVLQVKDLFYLLLIERESRRFLLLRPWERHGMKLSPFQAPDFYGSPFSGGGAPRCFAPRLRLGAL
jgi:hypothetical protein